MSTALERITSKRTWFVPGVVVSGVSGVETVDYLAVETIDGQATVLYGNADIGQGAQQFSFEHLTDDRGNQLPKTLDGPRVIVRATGENTAFVVGQESDTGFKLARSTSAGADVIVDLLIIEHGR
jgi:hypothetical protein